MRGSVYPGNKHAGVSSSTPAADEVTTRPSDRANRKPAPPCATTRKRVALSTPLPTVHCVHVDPKGRRAIALAPGKVQSYAVVSVFSPGREGETWSPRRRTL